MLDMFRKIWKTGTVTEEELCNFVPEKYKGLIEIDIQKCNSCRKCVANCPTKAISFDNKIVIDYKKCIYCGYCLKYCSEKALIQTNKIYNIVEQEELYHKILQQKIKKILGGSLHIRHVDTGSCNACDFEMTMLSNAFYDLSRWGVSFVASPRHADLLMITGGVTKNLLSALRDVYEATPNPKIIMAVGACAISGGIIGSNYANVGAVEKVVPIDVMVPGCPPRPQALIEGILLGLLKYEEKIKRGVTLEPGITKI